MRISPVNTNNGEEWRTEGAHKGSGYFRVDEEKDQGMRGRATGTRKKGKDKKWRRGRGREPVTAIRGERASRGRNGGT